MPMRGDHSSRFVGKTEVIQPVGSKNADSTTGARSLLQAVHDIHLEKKKLAATHGAASPTSEFNS